MNIMGVEFPNIKNPQENTEYTYEGLRKMQLDYENSRKGTLADCDCPDCLNRGYSMVIRNDEFVMIECHCMDKRRSWQRIEQSGLKQVLDRLTFDTYKATEDWQKYAKDKALNFVDDCEGKWFFAGGQQGSGKTHLCTAITGELLKRGQPARYMLWRDEIARLKNVIADPEYQSLMDDFRKVKVLYIDDLFKTGKVKDRSGEMVYALPTDSDIKITFELLNYRYIHRELITIISCEKTTDALLDIDEGIGSRIYEMTKEYNLCISQNRHKNYRLGGG